MCIPVYNRSKFVKTAIDSVLSQTNQDFEIIVVDDGSTDDTLKVLESYGDKIKVMTQANQGPEVARNTSAAVAAGEYLAFLDSDDFMLPWALETYGRVVVSQDQPAVILSHLKFFSESNAIVLEEL